MCKPNINMLKNLELFVEIVSFCNFKCVFCKNEVNRNNNNTMNLDLFKEIVIFFTKITHRLQINLFSSFGESFLHPNLLDIISFCSKYENLFLSLLTNGSVLFRDQFLFETIKKGKNNGLCVSVYGKDYDEFLKITRYEKFSERDYNEFISFLRINSIPVQLRTLEKSGCFIDGLNIKECLNEFASWDHVSTSNRKTYCPSFLICMINTNGEMFLCPSRFLTKDEMIGSFSLNEDNELNFKSKENLNDLITNYIKFGRNGLRTCMYCNFPEIKNMVLDSLSFENVLFLRETCRMFKEIQ